MQSGVESRNGLATPPQDRRPDTPVTRAARMGFGGITTRAAAERPDGDETLIWLAGNRIPRPYKGTDRSGGTAPSRTDRVLLQARPADPVEAAKQRASILADLRRHDPEDERVRAVFETDPIVAEDPSNGNLVTRAMVTARLDIFDAVLAMLGQPILSRGARTRLWLTLKAAYAMLTDDAQVEWAQSEVRLEESRVFLDRRDETELDALRAQLLEVMDRADIWSAARAFSIATHIGCNGGKASAYLADLLEMRTFQEAT